MTTLNDLDAIGGGSAKLWTSGETVTQWDYRKSPLDGEIYQRKAATGGGTTDPADDVTNYNAASYARVTALPAVTMGPTAVASPSNNFARGSVKPALTASAVGIRALQLSFTGRGNVGFLGFCRASSSGDTRLEIFVDGRSVLDLTRTFTFNDCAVYFGTAVDDPAGAGPLRNAISDGAGIPFKRTFQVFMTPVTLTHSASDFLAYKMRSEA